MTIFETILAIVEAGLSIWASKERTKYIDKLTKLKEQYHVEINKPDDLRDDAVITNLEFELRITGLAFSADVGKSNLANKQGPTGL